MLSRYGKRLKVCEWLIFNYEWRDREAQAPNLYVGWTVPKKVGKAVFRNKLKRWARDFFRTKAVEEDKALYLNLVFREQKNGSHKEITFDEFTNQLSVGWKNISNKRKKAFDG